MSMQEPANHYRLGLKLGTYCDNAPGNESRVAANVVVVILVGIFVVIRFSNP